MENVTLNVGICSCVQDWHGRFDGHTFIAGSKRFVFNEKIIAENPHLSGYHFWVDRHYVKYGFLDHHTFDTFVTLVAQHALFDIWWRTKKKPRFLRLLQAMEKLVQKAQKKCGSSKWWQQR